MTKPEHPSAASPAAAATALRSGFIAAATSAVVLLALYGFTPYASGYGSNLVTILHFAKELWKSEDWQHCFLVPIAVGAMVYVKRKQLPLETLNPSWSGLAVTLVGLAIYWLGFRADNIYIGYASFQVLTAGLLLWFCGWRWFRTLFFAWAFLVFFYPVPFLDNAVAFPLRMVMSQASVNALNFVGVGAIKAGTAILSAPDTLSGLKAGERFSVDVADPCSGIRSLFALMMVSALYGYFTQPGVWRKVFMFLCSLPLAVLGNLARILMLTIGTIAFGSNFAIGPADEPSTFHMFAGFLVFGVAILGLIGIGHLLNMDWPATYARLRKGLESPPRPAAPRPAAPLSPGAKPTRIHDEY